jgi:hypothetical protein
LRVTRDLANVASPPAFVSGTPLATYGDAVVLQRVLERLWLDRDRFSTQDQNTLNGFRSDLARIVGDGEAAFGSDDVSTLLSDAATVVNSILVKGPCDGVLAPAQQRQSEAVARLLR